ncbi:hypothetical protein BU25DRAFT_419852 [Macroventuria anomochaeta]|uniref:Uncharacterized protein n=1 Tax=Macroventuria anomochaeta TaxID=301207 RepID=A0ACB6S8S8_9PLEO|nr:uncharacterized protein BU25DRAFT_419852 [Macroventuria anomochaeta]KAF2629542.1 hypothetical protein BU25DRAFT_419852 [Macroventuria anomochaeta]
MSGPKTTPDTKTVRRNLEAFQVPGALLEVHLPRTVKEAMVACAQLEQRYLWVDRLCILQADKTNQICTMDKICLSAQHVIIAYGSENMHPGLSGVSRPRPQTQMSVSFAGLAVTSEGFDDFCDSEFKGCIRQERGWT